jgi:hypothetical protein
MRRIWELAVAVEGSPGLAQKTQLSSELRELGDLTRDVKDSMIALSVQNVNAFSWILFEVSRTQTIPNRDAFLQAFSVQFERLELVLRLATHEGGFDRIGWRCKLRLIMYTFMS